MIGLGVVPTGLLTLYLGSMGLFVGVAALAEGDVFGSLMVAWVLAGVFGLVALATASSRFGAGDFGLKRWEVVGVSCGLAACAPFPFLVYHADGFHPSNVYVFAPVSLSAVCALVIISSKRLMT